MALVRALGLLILICPLVSASVFVVDGSSEQLSNATFDYVIVGCGISGLVVANRLSEDENVTVLCLEAGAL